MVYWVIMFLLGELIGHLFAINQGFSLVIGIVILVGMNRVSHCPGIKRLVIIWWLGFAFVILGCIRIYHWEQNIRRCEALYDKEVLIKGQIIKRIDKEEQKKYQLQFVNLNGKLCIGKAQFEWMGELYPGDFVEMQGIGEAFLRATNPGGYDEKDNAYQNGICLKMKDIVLSKQARTKISIRYEAYCVRRYISDVYKKLFSEAEASLANAMVLGEKSMLDQDIKALYQRNGIAHLIAISGLHVAMIGGTIYHLLRKLLGGYFVSALIGMLFILLYGFMTGLSGATVRAITMLIMMIGAEMFGRCYDAMTAIFVALFIMLIANPFQIGQAGFWLSFGAVVGIVWVAPILQQSFLGKLLPISNFWVSVSVQLVTFPIIIWFFYEIPVWGIFLNLIVVPLMSLLLFFLLVAGVLGCVSFSFAKSFAFFAHMIFCFYEWICVQFERLPFHTICLGRPSILCIFIYYIFLLAFLMASSRKWFVKYKRLFLVVGSICMMLVVVCVKIPQTLCICMFDVGQGDGIYVQTPNRIHILVDGGSSSVFKVGKYVLKNGTKFYGANELDYVFVTHMDRDHYEGIEELIADKTYQIHNLVLPAISNPDEAYLRLENEAQSHGIQIYHMKRGDCISFGEVRFQCLNPMKQVYEDKNQGSLVLLLNYHNFDMLFMADADKSVEEELLANGLVGQSRVDVLKVAHHGSKTASSETFLAAIRCKTALVSVALKNQYGHPATEVMRRLQEYCKKIYLTKDNGAVTIESDGKKYKVIPYIEDDSFFTKMGIEASRQNGRIENESD